MRIAATALAALIVFFGLPGFVVAQDTEEKGKKEAEEEKKDEQVIKGSHFGAFKMRSIRWILLCFSR